MSKTPIFFDRNERGRQIVFMNRLKSIKDFYLKSKAKWKEFKNNNYSDTERSKTWLFHFLCFILFGSLFVHTGLPQGISFILFGVIFVLGMNLVRILLTWFMKLTFRNNITSGVYGILIFFLIFFVIAAGAYTLPIPILLLVSIIITWIEVMFVKSLWSFFYIKRRTMPVIVVLVISFVINIMIGAVLTGQGFQDDYMDNYISISQEQGNESTSKQIEAIASGKLSVRCREYGADNIDLVQKTTDLSPYISSYKGIRSMIRGLYWGYGIDEVPLKGKIWYPSKGENYPVLFLIHGNHIMTTKSYLGYDYLGEYLASFGYVVISVDEAFCNSYINLGLSDENDARAVLLLENMKLIESYNENQDSFLYHKMDFNNIALAGHSRGGESIATAALFNRYEVYPEDGNIIFDYHFNIKSLIAISPTVDQYKPAEHEVQLQNVNYLLIHGSNDQDVNEFMGYSQYHNISFDKDSNYFKAYLYIIGANHGQFNKLWGRYDLPYPMKPFLNTKNLMDADQQREILKRYTKTFLDMTLKNTKTDTSLFADSKTDQGFPETIYINNYQDSSFELLCGFDEDSNIKYGTKDGVYMESGNMSVWKEVKNSIYKSISDHVLQLEWEDTSEAYYSIHLPEKDGEEEYLQFDIMDMNQEENKKKVVPLDAIITLTDASGNSSSIPMQEDTTVYPPLPVKLFKLQFLTNINNYKQCFQTVRLSCKEFEDRNKEFDSTSIVKIKFDFGNNENGKIRMDNIGFSK